MRAKTTTIFFLAFLMLATLVQAQNSSNRGDEYRTPSMRQMIKTEKPQKQSSPKDVKSETIARERIEKAARFMPSSIILQIYEDDISDWMNELKISVVYEAGLEKEQIYSLYEDDEFVEFMKEVMFYNSAGLLEETEIFYMFEGEWILHEKNSTHYDQYGNLILDAWYYWDDFNEEWLLMFGEKIDYVYDAQGNALEIIYIWYDSWEEIWVPVWKEKFIYQDGRVIELIVEEYDEFAMVFIPEHREVYTYNAAGEWSQALIYNYSNEWVLTGKVEDIIWFNFADLKPSQYIVYGILRADIWEPFYKVIIEYHPVLEEITLGIFYYWVGSWEPSFRMIAEFDDQLMPLLITEEDYYDNQWELYFGLRYDNKYNDDNSPKMVTIEFFDSWEEGIWINWIRLLFNYDAEGNVSIKPDMQQMPTIVNVYPNPAVNNINLTFGRDEDNVRVHVYNVAGQVVMQRDFSNVSANSNSQMDISGLKTGFYLMNIHSGQNSQTVRILKK
jgi:hypothetical protein